MAAISSLPGIESCMREFVEELGLSYVLISEVLKRMYPDVRGFSPMSVRRYCRTRGIRKTSRLDDVQLDVEVTTGIMEV